MSQTDKRAVRAIHAWLMDRFPLAFPKDYDARFPLKVSILANVIAPMPGFDPVLLRRALANHTRRDGYLLALIHGRGDRRYDLDGQPAGIVTPEERAEAARLLAASTQRGQAQAVRVREHQEREEQRRQQRERERRRREAKAARKAEYERQQQEIAAARSPWPCKGSWWNRAPSASAAWPAKRRPGPKASRAPGCPPSSCVVSRPRPPARRWTSRADAGSPRTRAGPAAAAGRISQQAPVRAATER